jgi:hypothetical protein
MAIAVMVLAFAQQSEAVLGPDRELFAEITAWKKGNPPPPRLLQFPKGPPALPPLCGMRAFGDAVEDYISRISDDELLKSLLFDYRADNACVRAAASRLLERCGVKELRALLSERRKTNPGDFTRSELATLTQLLASPYAWIRVASLDKKDVSKEVAEKTLAGLKADLTAGLAWGDAYSKAADLLPDKERSRKEGTRITFLCYSYSGLISPTGFDLHTRFISDRLDASHIRKLFETKQRLYQHETTSAYWLYFVEKFYDE